MRRVIKLKESDLEVIIKTLLEQNLQQRYGVDPSRAPSDYLGKGGEFERRLKNDRGVEPQSYEKCVPDPLKGFIKYVMTNKASLMKQLGVDEKTLMLMVKAAIGIIGRETQYGTVTEFADDVAEFLRNKGLGGLVNLGIGAQNLVTGGKNTQSLGLAQFTPETWKRYGLDKSVGDFDTSFGAIKQGLASLFRLDMDYKRAINAGLNPQVASNNPILEKNGIISKINGTGNHVLDVAIVSHNMTPEKLVTKYCTTNNPLWAAPCNLSSYQPFDSQESFDKYKTTSKLISNAKVDPKYKNFPGKLTVNSNQVIPGYFPNLKGPNHTAIGYLEQVVKNVGSLTCF